MRDERIPKQHRVWAFCYCTKIHDSDKRVFAVRAVRETPMPSGGFVADLLTDPRSIAALDVAERHARGNATDKELAAAWAAAWAAEGTAEWAAAWAAEGAAEGTAAWAAAWAATRAAAMAAARAATRAATRDATRAAAWDAQLNIILSMIEQ